VALAIADAEGFEAVSMRRIAAELRSGTMTLYHYLETKDDLVDLLHDAILAEALVPEDEFPSDWRGALSAIARHTRTALLAHPWSLTALQGAILGPNAFRHIDQSLAALAGTSLSDDAKSELLALVDDYVGGYVLHLVEVLAISPRQRERGLAAEEWARDELRSGEYPHIPAVPEGTVLSDAWDDIASRLTDDARFERGLAALLDGAARQYGLEG
jgi:AcrR family transcriptional regulator